MGPRASAVYAADALRNPTRAYFQAPRPFFAFSDFLFRVAFDTLSSFQSWNFFTFAFLCILVSDFRFLTNVFRFSRIGSGAAHQRTALAVRMAKLAAEGTRL